MKSKLPLDIPELLKIIRPGAKYKLTSRKYDGIMWFDKKQKKPSIEELETAFIERHNAFCPKPPKKSIWKKITSAFKKKK